MALFGLEGSPDHGARAALNWALSMLEKLGNLNKQLAYELSEPLAMGIGIHTGDAIVGRMGPPKTPIISAVADSVNTAARLETSSKELHVPLVVSLDTLRSRALEASLPLQEIALRGRTDRLNVVAFDEATLRQLLHDAFAANV